MAGEQQLTPEQIEAEALREAQAGYDKTARGTEPPAPSPAPAPESNAHTAQPLADQTEPDEEIPGGPGAQADPEPEPPKPDPIAIVSGHLNALRAQVQELASQGGAAAEVRKLHGDIGNINRTLLELQQAAKAKAADAPESEDELSAALKKAEEVAEQFPEIAGPLVATVKALQAKIAAATPAPQATPPAPAPEPPASQPAAAPAVDLEAVRTQTRQQMAIEAIDELHPDRHQVKESPEFKAWFGAKPPEYQQRVLTTWNPAVLSKCFDDFKAHQAARKRKQERLDAAATPEGTGGTRGPETITDEQAAWAGYNRQPRRI